ncbi:MAG: hypothetical protein K5662_04900 [Lachnospiraceae bacterium]|nr:hypothetical protein [Lachnospiraceae bacterium]
MPILPDDLQKKQRIVYQYLIGCGVFKEGTPDYVLEYDKEIQDFYDKEMDGVM